jgi:CO/xanthine dehydrogenase FAD-binding subunit
LERFWNPRDLDEALAILDGEREAVMSVAGGTDLMLRLRQGRFAPRGLVSVRRLRTVVDGPARVDGDALQIDALAPLADVIASPIVQAHAPELVAALATIGSPAIRNVATLAGNVANASPAADSLPALLVHDAEVELTRRGGARIVPLASFVTGPGRTGRAPDELLTAIRMPLSPVAGRRVSVFRKFGKRRANVIASANLAARLVVAEGHVDYARLAAGGVAATPRRLPAVEQALRGQRADADLFARIEDAVVAAVDALLRPISDVRGGAAFKRALVLHAIEGACAEVARASSGEEVGDVA